MVKTGVSPPMGTQIIWKKLAYPLPWELRSCGKNWRIPSHGSSDPMEKNWRIPSHGSSDHVEKTGVSPPMGAQILWKKLAYPLPWELTSGPGLGARARSFLRALISKSGLSPRLEMSAVYIYTYIYTVDGIIKLPQGPYV